MPLVPRYEHFALRASRLVLLLAPLLVVLTQVITPAAGRTLPLFSKVYSVACSRCHASFPRLNAFGITFRQDGYRVAGEPGQPPWKSRRIPLSLIGNVGYAFTSTDTADLATGARARSNLSEFRRNPIEIHSAGTMADNVSFDFDGGFVAGRDAFRTEMAFVQLDDLIKRGALNLKLGIYDAEIPFLASSRRTTLHEYLSPVTLDAHGLELNDARSSWTYAAGLISSERHRASGRNLSSVFTRLADTYVWIMRDVGGQRMAARMFFCR